MEEMSFHVKYLIEVDPSKPTPAIVIPYPLLLNLH